jgi:hypothetical protein
VMIIVVAVVVLFFKKLKYITLKTSNKKYNHV